jgi:hypothetical protein
MTWKGTLHFVSRSFAAGNEASLPRCEGRFVVARSNDVFYCGAAFGIHVKFSVQGSVYHAGGIGEHDGLYAHLLSDPLDLRHVGRLYKTGHNIDLVRLLARVFRQILDHALGHVCKARDVGALEARRVRVDHPLSLGDLPVGDGLVDDLLQVIADDLGQARGMDGDDVGA